MSSIPNEQSGIQVSVVPSQSAFFAGETFSVSITFTNTRSSEPSRPHPRSASFTPLHRRGAHSVSSVPLAKPPTSPRSPQTANAFTPAFPSADEGTTRIRKGLVGRKPTKSRVSEVAAQESKRKARATKASSISLTPSELVERLGGRSPTPTPSSRDVSSSSMPDVTTKNNGSSAIARAADAKLALHPSHPHARKESVESFKVQELATPSFSVSLDPIAEVPGPSPATPFIPSPSPAPTAAFGLTNGNRLNSRHERVPQARGNHNRSASLVAAAGSGIGLGKPSTVASGQTRQPRSAFSSTFSPPGTEVLLWAYAKLTGTVEFDETVVSPSIVDAMRERLRAVGSVGGGSMDIGSPVSPSSGFLSAFLPQRSPRPPAPRHNRSSSIIPGFSSLSLSSLLSVARLSSATASPLSNPDEGDLPTLDSRPNILVVDLALTPGESRTYTYKVALPSVLPPTFRGKALRFSYELVLGTSHTPSSSGPSPLSTSSSDQQRKLIMKIPIRLYNAVSVHSPSSCYELLWPLQQRKEVSSRVPTPEPRQTDDDEDDFTCREAVEILTRNSRKVSYDIHKDGEKVAVLTLTKSSYRLGETVMGVVEINDAEWSTRVLKFSAFLEAHEQVPPSFLHAGKHDLRRVHAEYHSSITPNTLRTPFTLDVPSDGSPAFQFSARTLSEGTGGLEWRVRLCFLVAVGGATVRHLVHEEHEDEWGSAYRAAPTLAPLVLRKAVTPGSVPSTPVPGAWSELFASMGGESAVRDGEGGEEWVETRLETVECEIGVRVFAANTVFQPVETVFRA